jgi:hypothetical protein
VVGAILLLAGVMSGPAAEILWKARNIAWTDTAGIKGAKNAPLWSEGTLHRLPINLVLPGEARPQGARILVMLGAISVEVAGKPAGEFGPGSFVSIPSGAKYALTTTAAGECTFLLQQADSAAAEVLWKARNIAWADTAGIKGAKNAPLWSEGTLHRLPINLVLPGEARPQATRVLVMLGAISVEIAGKSSGEFGPGSFVSIPAGAKYALTTTAAGECTFLLQ